VLVAVEADPGVDHVQPEAPGTTYHASAFPLPARDLARAKALVAEHGGHPAVNLLIGSDPLDARVAQVIQAMAGEAGFDVKITVMEAATLLNRITNGTGTGAVALTAATVGQNVDLSASGFNLPSMSLGATGGTVTYTAGATSPCTGSHRRVAADCRHCARRRPQR